MKYNKILKATTIALIFVLLFGFTVSAKTTPSSNKTKKTEQPKFDLSGMSYEELVELKDQINLAIWESEEWEEVTVPQGTWVVGEDIPVGVWTIKCANVSEDDVLLGSSEIWWGYLNDNGTKNTAGNSPHGSEYVHDPKNTNYEVGEQTEIILDLKDGMVVMVDGSGAPAVFCTYSGKPSLGFK